MIDDRQVLREIASRPDQRIDLVEASLWIARSEYPDLEPHAYERSIETLARAARERIDPQLGDVERLARLNHFLFVEEGFAGNQEEYYDPRNSFLNEVLDRRLGIPITLSVVYLAVGRALGLPIWGVSFPGHFLVKYEGERDVLIDPFHGTVVSEEECRDRLADLDEPVDEGEGLFRRANNRETVVRILRNLKQIYVARDDHARALECSERILLFLPSDAEEIRDRGILYMRLECFASALRDFERFLEARPDAEGVEAIREALPELRREAGRLH